MSFFWMRKAELSIARATPLLPIKIESPLRIQFKIKKKPLHPPNTAEITITNLSATTRNQMQEFGAEFYLKAGYEHHLPNLPIIFRGEARTVDHRRSKSDWHTIIQCGDGDFAFRFAKVTLPWKPGTPIPEVLADLAKELVKSGIDIKGFLTNLKDGKIKTSKEQFFNGYASQGNPLEELDKILAPEGWVVSIQNGELQVISSTGISPKKAILISEDSGLLGSPIYGAPDHNGLASVLKIQSLLLPTLNPNDAFVLKSKFINGVFRAEEVSHHGDTHGGKWETEIETRQRIA